MPYNFVADSFQTKKLCSRLSQAKCDFRRKSAALRFWAPFWGLRSNVQWSCHVIRLIGKRVVDFLLVLMELFSLSVTAEALRAIIGSKSAISLQRGTGWPKITGRWGCPTNHFFSQKTRLNDLSYGIKIRTDIRPFCHNARVWQRDRQTDRQTDVTEFSSLDRVCITCSAVKKQVSSIFRALVGRKTPVWSGMSRAQPSQTLHCATASTDSLMCNYACNIAATLRNNGICIMRALLPCLLPYRGRSVASPGYWLDLTSESTNHRLTVIDPCPARLGLGPVDATRYVNAITSATTRYAGFHAPPINSRTVRFGFATTRDEFRAFFLSPNSQNYN